MSKRPKRNAGALDDAAKPDDGTAIVNDDAGNDGSVGSAAFETVTIPGAVDPTTAAASDEPADQPKRGRGRPRGSGTGASTKAKPLPLNVTGLEKLLVGIHGGVAILSGRSEWSLDTDSKIFDGKTEAEFLAGSIKDVADHYGNGLLDKKTLDWCNLIQCLAIVYGGRIYTIRANPKIRIPKPQPPSSMRTAPPPMQQSPLPVNVFDPRADSGDMGTGEIAGIGAVEFPDGHPLKPKLN